MSKTKPTPNITKSFSQKNSQKLETNIKQGSSTNPMQDRSFSYHNQSYNTPMTMNHKMRDHNLDNFCSQMPSGIKRNRGNGNQSFVTDNMVRFNKNANERQQIPTASHTQIRNNNKLQSERQLHWNKPDFLLMQRHQQQWQTKIT
jgi:hypothetical protein